LQVLGPTSVLLWALAATPASATAAAPVLEPVAALADRPGALAAIGSRLFVALHPLANPEVKLLEVRNGRLDPYPSGVVSREFGAITALASDGEGGLWILDAGDGQKRPEVLAWNTVVERRLGLYRLSATALRPNSYLAALVVDPGRGLLYIADRSKADWVGDSHPAILVHSLRTGFTRRVLEDHPALEPDAVPVVIGRRALAHHNVDGTLEKVRLGVNQLGLDASGSWLYLGGLNCAAVWRVRTADLVDLSLSPAELATRVESFAERPAGNALLVEPGGRVVVTEVEQRALAFAAPGGTVRWLTDPRLNWPDALAYAEGWLYLGVNQLHLHPALNRGTEESRGPYPIYRIALPPPPPPRPAARATTDAGVETDGGPGER
jgi:hypothetical protein